MDEPNQESKSGGIIPKDHLRALSWNIATEPKLYWQLAHNPYTPRALQIISDRFPDTNTVVIIKAVILAEPEGKYDRNFRLLPQAQQETELAKQKTLAKGVNKRLLQYGKKHALEFNRHSKEFVYNSLSFFLFKTTDVKAIEERYAQKQRREYKLAIVTFIEDTHRKSSQQSKHTPSRRTLVKGFSAALILILILSLTQKQIQSMLQHANAKKQNLGAETQSQTFPVRLKIPKINIDTAVEYVGITPLGTMDVPSNIINVGWYKLGPTPGQIGSAVISGHFDGKKGESGVFNNLDKLTQGDSVYVTDALGTTMMFVVKESRTYNPGYAEDVFLPKDNGTHLNLITCDGVWNKNKKSYSKRLVVFADLTR